MKEKQDLVTLRLVGCLEVSSESAAKTASDTSNLELLDC